MIVGLLGYARVGKDEVANILSEDFGFQKHAYASHLKEQLEVLNPIIGSYGGDPVRLNDALEQHGWDGLKNTLYGPEVRRLMQVFGTEVAKEIAGKRVWIERVINDIVISPAEHHVISDVRFEDEYEWMHMRKRIDDKSVIFIRVERPDTGPANHHRSEYELIGVDVDHVVKNDGTLGELRAKINAIMGIYKEKL